MQGQFNQNARMRIGKKGHEELFKMEFSQVYIQVILCMLLIEFSKIYLNVTIESRGLYLFIWS